MTTTPSYLDGCEFSQLKTEFIHENKCKEDDEELGKEEEEGIRLRGGAGEEEEEKRRRRGKQMWTLSFCHCNCNKNLCVCVCVSACHGAVVFLRLCRVLLYFW